MSEPPRDQLDDDDLIRAIKGDPGGPAARTAADVLLRRYGTRVYLWCFRMVRDHDLALDLAQDALISACRALREFDGRARFSSWLFSIVHNRCKTALRPRSLTRDDDADPDLIADENRDPEALLIEKEGEEALERLIIEHLEPEEQEAIWLRCVERMPVEEITRVLGITTASGARGVLQAARRKLRSALGRDPNDELRGRG